MKNFILKNKLILSLGAIILFICVIFLFPTEARVIEHNDSDRQSIIENSNDIIIEQSNEKSINLKLIKELENKNKAIENDISRMEVCKALNKALMGSLEKAIDCDTISSMKLKKPEELFYTFKVSDKPYISQPEENHFHKGAGAVLATDVATGFQAEVYAPDYISEIKMYTVEVFNGENSDPLLGDYVKMNFKHEGKEYFWIIAHIDTKLKTGDVVYTGQRIGQTNLSGATNGHHSHIELWFEGVNISYSTRSKTLINSRAGIYENDGENYIYLTTYDLGDVNQNDSTPCIGASGKNLCELAETGVQSIALTVDMREKYGIEFGDKIILEHKFTGDQYEVQVEDEMNKRFRYACIRKDGYCIKGDVARYNGKTQNGIFSGIFIIKKEDI